MPTITTRTRAALAAYDAIDRELEVARSWAAFNVDRTRDFVTHLTTNPAT